MLLIFCQFLELSAKRRGGFFNKVKHIINRRVLQTAKLSMNSRQVIMIVFIDIKVIRTVIRLNFMQFLHNKVGFVKIVADCNLKYAAASDI